MLGWIWFGMITVSFVCALINGRMEELSRAAVSGADQAVELIINMAGVMCLWTGVMKIAEKSGVTMFISRILSPVLSRLMPDYDKSSRAMSSISANVTANILGLGNAATPFGIEAMKEMQKTNKSQNRPNRSMIMFVVINTASVQIVPTTIAALRRAAGSEQPYGVTGYIWIASSVTLAIGIALAAVLCMRKNGTENGYAVNARTPKRIRHDYLSGEGG